MTINGLLDPIERAKSIERVENGSALCIIHCPGIVTVLKPLNVYYLDVKSPGL